MSTAEAYNGAGGRRDPGVIGRMWAMIVKEFVQMRRDRMTFATMLFVPILIPRTCRRPCLCATTGRSPALCSAP